MSATSTIRVNVAAAGSVERLTETSISRARREAVVQGNQLFLERLRRLVGRRHVVTGHATKPYATGYRFGSGPVAAAVRPGSLVEMWRVVQACVEGGRIIIVQAANTGLTGGSTPYGEYDRDVVVVSTCRIRGIHLIHRGEQVVCLAGTTLYDLERTLAAIGREPHSVIGSSCIGASVVGGVCNNSGGALVRRGPGYTEYALFAQVNGSGQLELLNHLGIQLGDDPETILNNLETGRFGDADIECNSRSASAAASYETKVRGINEPTPARFNADPDKLFEAAGSAGKVVVFAVRMATFEKPKACKVFYIGTNQPYELTEVRRRMLSGAASLPVSAEYIHREAFDYADVYGKDTVLAIRALGSHRLPLLFGLKRWIDRLARRLCLPVSTSDRLLQVVAQSLPDHLPHRMRVFRDCYEHHLILTISDDGLEDTCQLLSKVFPSANGNMFECSPEEAEVAQLHRFAVAGAAVRYRALHAKTVQDIVALDVALPRNALEWVERLPEELDVQVIGKLYYGHFFCHVFHRDYLVKKGADPAAVEHRLLKTLDDRGAEYPAEHNVGHLYSAKSALKSHYRNLDPTNVFAPGVGKTSRFRNWQ